MHRPRFVESLLPIISNGENIGALLFHFSKESTMFSNWFSGDECGQYRTSPHKQRMDQVGSSLLELRYANEVIRQHLHEWLRFSRFLVEKKNGSSFLQAPGADAIRRYL